MTTSINIVPNMERFRRVVLDGANARCRCTVVPVAPSRTAEPGKLAEYPSRVEHARAHRLRSEIRRRDRRRARTGRTPIQPATYPKRRPMIPLAMRQQVARFAAVSGQALRAVEHAFMATRDAMRAFAASDPFRAVREELERSFTESFVQHQAVVRTQAPVDYESIVQLYAEAEQWDAERADDYRRAFERIRDRAAVDWPRRLATGGRIHERRDSVPDRLLAFTSSGEVGPPLSAHHHEQFLRALNGPRFYAAGGVIHERRDPDDDSILAFLSPGEVHASPETIRRYGPLLRAINGGSGTILRPTDPDVTHRDRYLGEGALDRDETSSVHSTDSSGTGAVWSDLMARIDDLVDGEE